MTVFKVGKNDTKWLNPACMMDSDFLDLSLFGFGHWEFSHCVFNWKEEGKSTKSQWYTIFTIVTNNLACKPSMILCGWINPVATLTNSDMTKIKLLTS